MPVSQEIVRLANPLFRLERLREAHAREIMNWRYIPPYNFYDPPDDVEPDDFVAALLDPVYRFHAVLDAQGNFSGFCSYGEDGQVPGGNYPPNALDIGLGMKPALTGRGLGRGFFKSILSFAEHHFPLDRHRLTVANFNRRAIRVYESFGFHKTDEFTDAVYEVPYSVMVRDAGR